MIYVPLNETLNETMEDKVNIIDILKKIPRDRIRGMQNEIEAIRHVMQYSLTPHWDNVRLGRLQELEETDDAATLMIKDALLMGMDKFGLPMPLPGRDVAM